MTDLSDRHLEGVHPPAVGLGVGLVLFPIALSDCEDVEPEEGVVPREALAAGVLAVKKSLEGAADLLKRIVPGVDTKTFARAACPSA